MVVSCGRFLLGLQGCRAPTRRVRTRTKTFGFVFRGFGAVLVVVEPDAEEAVDVAGLSCGMMSISSSSSSVRSDSSAPGDEGRPGAEDS